MLRETHEEMGPVLRELVTRRRALIDLKDQRYDPDYRANWTRMVEEEEAFVKKGPRIGWSGKVHIEVETGGAVALGSR